jgi:hypothetical protein
MQHDNGALSDATWRNEILEDIGIPIRMSRSLMRKALMHAVYDCITHIEIEADRSALFVKVPGQDKDDGLLVALHIYAPGSQSSDRNSYFVDLPHKPDHPHQSASERCIVVVDVQYPHHSCNVDAVQSLCISPLRPVIILQIHRPITCEYEPSFVPTLSNPSPHTHAVTIPSITSTRPDDRPMCDDGPMCATDSRAVPATGNPIACLGHAEMIGAGTACLKGIDDIRCMYLALSNGIDAYINMSKVKAFMILSNVIPPICATCNAGYVQHEAKSGTTVSASCSHDSKELACLLTSKDHINIDQDTFQSTLASALCELHALRDWKVRALVTLKAQELSNLAQKERAFLVSHNIASEKLNSHKHVFDLIRLHTGEVDEALQLAANIEACSSNMHWFEDTSPARARFRFKLTIAPPVLEPDKYRIITARAAPSWSGLVKALTSNWDETTNLPTRTLLNNNVIKAIESRKRKRPAKSKFAVQDK